MRERVAEVPKGLKRGAHFTCNQVRTSRQSDLVEEAYVIKQFGAIGILRREDPGQQRFDVQLTSQNGNQVIVPAEGFHDRGHEADNCGSS